MSDWILVPSLVVLRTEFNTVAPARRKGADGSIGDSNHSSSSDHTPDEDSDVLRDHDADSKNEVHALDIDSAGPWPGGPAWFDRAIHAIVAREKAAGAGARLQYVIWNRQIANREIDNWRWRTYTSTTDPHTNHAHFSSRYTTAAESNTAPWGLLEDDMDFATKLTLTKDAAKALGTAYDEGDEIPFATATNLELIHAARASGGIGALNTRMAGLEKTVEGIGAALIAIRTAIAELSVATGADPGVIAADIARRISNG